jgi:hypothetical protein
MNEAIDDVQRLHYLKESLKGEAATLESTIDSIQSLWAAVCKRYEIRRIIVDKHIDELIHIKPIRQVSFGDLRCEESARAFRAIYGKFNQQPLRC